MKNARTARPRARRVDIDRSKPVIEWVRSVSFEGSPCWELMVYIGKPYTAATVWDNGVWHTWDRNGAGGENDAEVTVKKAKVEAAASAVAQGFI